MVVNMQNRTVLITGGTSGIGKQTALALAQAGAQVILNGRSRDSGESAVREVKQLSGNQKVDLLLADLSTQAGVHALADQFKQRYVQLDVLINNAGLAEPQRRLTADGVEADFAVNVVTPYLLTRLLMDCLKSSTSARVINVTGGSHPAKIDLNNVQGEQSFVGLTAYSHAKLAMMAVMYEFALRVQDSNVTINVCYPGQASTNMTRSVTAEMMPTGMRFIMPLFKWFTRPDNGKSAAKAARSSVYLATSPEVEGVTGKYFDTKSKIVPWPKAVLDPTVRQKLWTMVEHSIKAQ